MYIEKKTIRNLFRWTMNYICTGMSGMEALSSRNKFILRGLSSDSAPGNIRSSTSKLRVRHAIYMLALTSDIALIHMLEGILNRGTRHQLTVPGSEMRELFLDIEVGGKEMADRIVVVLDEGKIGDGALISDEPDIWCQQMLVDMKEATDHSFLLKTSFKTPKIRLISLWNLHHCE
jgi:hypothetical protein